MLGQTVAFFLSATYSIPMVKPISFRRYLTGRVLRGAAVTGAAVVPLDRTQVQTLAENAASLVDAVIRDETSRRDAEAFLRPIRARQAAERQAHPSVDAKKTAAEKLKAAVLALATEAGYQIEGDAIRNGENSDKVKVDAKDGFEITHHPGRGTHACRASAIEYDPIRERFAGTHGRRATAIVAEFLIEALGVPAS